MLKHFLNISLRRLLVDKAFSLINLVGLVIGISSVFLLSKYLGFHLTIDDFQERKNDIFAIHQTLKGKDHIEDYSENTFNEVAPLTKSQFPEVIGMSRYVHTGESLITAIGEKGEPSMFNERNIWEVDPDFIRMFTFDFLKGDPQKALDEPNSIVLSLSMAKKYFGDDDPLGQTITTTKPWYGKRIWTITGVFKDYPSNSIFEFDCLQSLAGTNLEEREQGGWTYPAFKSYLLLDKNADAQVLSEKIASVVTGIAGFKAQSLGIDFHLIEFDNENGLTKSQKILVLVGFVLLLITWINYTNLSGIKSLTRGKEFGVRRVLGSNRLQLIKQFLYEAILIYFIAAVGIAGVVVATYPMLFDLSDGQMLPIFETHTPINLIFLAFLLIGAVLSSTYPSFSVSSLSITRLLKNRKSGNPKSQGFRGFLVVFQFAISIVMLIGVTTIYQQMRFMTQQKMGFDMHQILILQSPKDKWNGKSERMRSFKNELRNKSFSKSISSSSSVPLWWPGSPTDFQIRNSQNETRLLLLGVDEEYFNCFDLDLILGEGFRSGQSQINHNGILVNETAIRKLGYTSPVEALNKKMLNLKTNKEFEIIGVVKDYHHESMRNEIKPQAFQHNSSSGFISINLNHSAQTSFENLSRTIKTIENIWFQTYPDQAFDYYFLDERFNTIYKGEKQFQKVFLTFAVISVIITFIGIFGLSIFISLQRKKEMGIRKVLGAKPYQVLALFFNEFMKKVGVAILIGTPFAYYLMDMWLSNFSYRISFNIWMLIMPGVFTSILVVISLSFEGIKMVNINPITILRDD